MIRIAVALLALAGPALAQALDIPEHGMTQNQVRERFGAPQQSKGPVGSPPISRWVYPGYTVYFENNVVLHSVTRPLSEASASPRDDTSGEAAPSPPEEHAEPTQDAAAPPVAAEESRDSEPGGGAGNGEFHFDPVTGRIVIDGRAEPKQDAEERAEDSAERSAEGSTKRSAADGH